MPRQFAALAMGIGLTAALIAALWYGAPLAGFDRPPGGLMGMIFSLGVVGSLAWGRSVLKNSPERK